MSEMPEDDNNKNSGSNITLKEDNNNNNPDNSNNNNVEATSNRPACAACKYQRKKCVKEQCRMLKHFPAEKAGIYAAIRKLFGQANVLKKINLLRPSEQVEAIKSYEWEASQWKKDKVHGPLGKYKSLKEKNRVIMEEYQKLLKENRLLKEQSRTTQQPKIENSSDNFGVLALQSGVGNMTNYDYHGSGSLSLQNAAQGSAFLHDQQRGEVVLSDSSLPPPAAAAYYNVNHHAQGIVNMGSHHHVGQSSSTTASYPLASGMYNPYPAIYPSIHHDFEAARKQMPFFAYPIPQQHQLMNSSQRNTLDNQ